MIRAHRGEVVLGTEKKKDGEKSESAEESTGRKNVCIGKMKFVKKDYNPSILIFFILPSILIS